LKFDCVLTENIMVSNNYRAHLDGLLAKLHEENTYSRVFGHLITRAFLGRLSGEHQVDAADRVLQVMGLEQLAGMESFLNGADNLQEVRLSSY
jgi:U3 small nucleolar RNA-associated protein 10